MTLELLDVLIGITTVYLVLSTVASAAAEMLEAIVRKRGRILVEGVLELLNSTASKNSHVQSEKSSQLAADLYNSPEISPLFKGLAISEGHTIKVVGGNLPSYIPSAQFADAVLALSRKQPKFATVALSTVGSKVGASPLATAEVRGQLVATYEAMGERLTGWYRRYVQWVLFAIALVLAMVLNIDSFRIIKVLSEDQKVRSLIVEQMIKDPSVAALNGLDGGCLKDKTQQILCLGKVVEKQIAFSGTLGLPLGWNHDPLRRDTRNATWLDYVEKVLGLLMTALAVSMGAPFWFDLLNKLTALRTSVKPTAVDPARTVGTGGSGDAPYVPDPDPTGSPSGKARVVDSTADLKGQSP